MVLSKPCARAAPMSARAVGNDSSVRAFAGLSTVPDDACRLLDARTNGRLTEAERKTA